MPPSDHSGPSAPKDSAVAALEQRVRELSEAVQARETFLAVVAHELRNPMTPILGTVQRMGRLAAAAPELPQEFRGAIERLEWLVERYVRRATSLLDVSRMNAGRHTLAAEPIDYVRTLRSTVKTVKPVATYARTPISLATPDTMHGTCDRLAFEQIAENLLTNAIKYGAGMPVSVSLEREATTIVLTVADQGPGISAADQQRIFQPFERVVAQAQNATGFGIGLWIVRQLVDAMDGSIELRSEVAQGSVFVVRIPVEARQVGTGGEKAP